MAHLVHRCATDQGFRLALQAGEITADELGMDEQEVFVVAEIMRRTEGLPLGDSKQHQQAIFGTPWPEGPRSKKFEQFLRESAEEIAARRSGDPVRERLGSAQAVVAHTCTCSVCQAGTDFAAARYHASINLLLSRLAEPERRWYVASLSLAPDAPTDDELSLITSLQTESIRRGRAELEADLSDPIQR